MEVTQAMTKNTPDAKAPDLPRFGMVMDLPYGMDKSQWYGRGPIENYSDRKLSERIGLYTLTADQQFYPYMRPQETGTKSDIAGDGYEERHPLVETERRQRSRPAHPAGKHLDGCRRAPL